MVITKATKRTKINEKSKKTKKSELQQKSTSKKKVIPSGLEKDIEIK